MLVEGGEKIVQVSCGYKHTVIKASSGKVYSWGLVKYN
jgi:alpha-tubulin suppressor-like RCC1 family protein